MKQARKTITNGFVKHFKDAVEKMEKALETAHPDSFEYFKLKYKIFEATIELDKALEATTLHIEKQAYETIKKARIAQVETLLDIRKGMYSTLKERIEKDYYTDALENINMVWELATIKSDIDSKQRILDELKKRLK
jgi:hypothetical protein